MKILSTAQMKSSETLMTNLGLNEDLLMENAGLALYTLLNKSYDLAGKNILILAGPGNNGGDALVLARKLFSNNISAETLFVSGYDSYRGAARKNLDLIIKLGINHKTYFDIQEFSTFIKDFDLIIDGIFGTGLNKNIENHIFEIIEKVNNSNKEVVSIDIPSGINGNSSELMGIAVKANKTLVLGRPKPANLIYPGVSFCGDLYLDKISIPDSFLENMNNEINLPIKYEKRKDDCNKGSFSKVLFVGGGKKYYGAPFLNSVSFLKSGGSYANLACPENLVGPLALKAHEIVFYPLKETREGNISIENLKTIIDISETKDLVVMGGGFSQEEEPQRLINILISKINTPILIDADGLNALKDKVDVLYNRNYPTILTPHLGEFSRLTGKSIEDIKKNIIELAREFATKYRVILVLKDSRTVIAMPSGKLYVNISGNSNLAVAGSGDILAGIIAGQFALGLNIEDAARMGVFLHGLCGDLLRDDIGQDGVMAEDILNKLPYTLKYYRENFSKILENYSLKLV